MVERHEMDVLHAIDLGRAPYARALALQEELLERAKRAGGRIDPRAILVEHDPPVITFGRRIRREHLLLDEPGLTGRGIELFQTARGGDVTYHGPGQLVVYPIVPLRGRDIHAYIRSLEEAVIRTVGDFGVVAERVEGFTGVWAGGEKVAAIGIAVSRWIAWHGLALNVEPDLSHFELIVPCGLARPVTSLSRILGHPVSMAQVKYALTGHLREVLGCQRVVAGPAI